MTSIEAHLGTGVFGDSEAIKADVRTLYDGVETLVSDLAGVALLPGTDTLACASLRRALLEQAFKDVIAKNRRRDEAAAFIAAGNELLHAASAAQDLDVGEGYRVLRPDHASKAWSHTSALVDRDLELDDLEFATPSRAHAEGIGRGLALVETALGRAGTDTVLHASGACLVRSPGIESAFLVPVPLISVFNERIVEDPVAMADAMLHEASHQKLYDLIATRHLLKPGHDFSRGRVYEVPWGYVGGRPRRMDVLRILSALHVYIHIVGLLIALTQKRHESTTLADRLPDYWARMRFFWVIAESGGLDGGLGADGVDMTSWIVEACRMHQTSMADLGYGLDEEYAGSAHAQVGSE